LHTQGSAVLSHRPGIRAFLVSLSVTRIMEGSQLALSRTGRTGRVSKGTDMAKAAPSPSCRTGGTGTATNRGSLVFAKVPLTTVSELLAIGPCPTNRYPRTAWLVARLRRARRDSSACRDRTPQRDRLRSAQPHRGVHKRPHSALRARGIPDQGVRNHVVPQPLCTVKESVVL
jgi:hypothetical protein